MNERPLVSFVLFAYNQEAFIRDACEAALAQTYSPLEIILSDDCSSDRTFAIMQELAAVYDGPHQLRLNRNARNMGLIPHVNLGQELASGELVVVAAGDDISAPERTSELVSAWLESKGKVFSLHSDVTRIDLAGNALGTGVAPIVRRPRDLADMALSMSLVIGATHAWARDVFDVFGPMRFPGAYEDLVIAYRSALLGGIHHVPRSLVQYRVGSGMTTAGGGKRSRQAQLQHLLKNLRVEIAVLNQRRADSAVAGRQDLVQIIENRLAECQLLLMIYGKEAPWLHIVRRALREGLAWRCFTAYVRYLRKFSFL